MTKIIKSNHQVYVYYMRKATEDLENKTNVKREKIKSMLEKIAIYSRVSLLKPLFTLYEE
jgi:hypothetical protein